MWGAGAQSLNGEQLQHVKEAALLHLLPAAYKHAPPRHPPNTHHIPSDARAPPRGSPQSAPALKAGEGEGGGGSSLNTHKHPLFFGCCCCLWRGGGFWLSSLLVSVFPLFFFFPAPVQSGNDSETRNTSYVGNYANGTPLGRDWV